MPATKLERTVIKLSGDGVAAWLEGLITNTLSGDLTFAALLTPQGKIIADFFIWQDADKPNDVIIDTPAKFGADLFKRLKMYRLRAPIMLEDISDDTNIYVFWGEQGDEGRVDPRHPDIRRIMSTRPLEAAASVEDWDAHRLSLNLPDSAWDFDSAQVFPANANMDQLSGVNFKKGCFVGQEVVSRMHRKTDIRKRLCAFAMSGAPDGAQIKAGDRVVGDILHTRGERGMAMMRFDRLEQTGDAPLTAGNAQITLNPAIAGG